jgi:hypothetical protein
MGFVCDVRRNGLPSAWWMAWLIGVLTVISACENREPVSVLGGCLIPAIESVRASGTSLTVACDLKRETFLVALPSVETSTETLMALGLSRAAAETVRHSGTSAPMWCSVDDMPDANEPPPAGTDKRLAANGACFHSDVAILTPMVVRAKEVSVTLQRSGTEVAVTKLADRQGATRKQEPLSR